MRIGNFYFCRNLENTPVKLANKSIVILVTSQENIHALIPISLRISQVFVGNSPRIRGKKVEMEKR